MEHGNIDILLVEDNPGDARLFRESLRESGTLRFSLVHVERVAEAGAMLVSHHFDVIFLDLKLPDSQGLETLLRMKEHLPDAPIIVLTGTDDEELGVRAVQAGAQDYLVKGKVDESLLVRSMFYAMERNRLQTALRSMSLVDELTGLYNRRGFLTFAEQQIRMAQRSGRGLWLVYADLDAFKSINDTYGHHEGDLALMDVGQVLRQTFRQSDILARLGGDEFAALAADASDDDTETLLRRLEENLIAYNDIARRPFQLRMSVGIDHYSADSDLTFEEHMARADARMYETKRHRKRSQSDRSLEGIGG